MRLVIQRVQKASVEINSTIYSAIENGLLVLIGIEDSDTDEDIEWLSGKLLAMRIFNDENDKMNLSVQDIGGQILLVSQFTLHAQVKKGNRPSFIRAAGTEKAIPLYEAFVAKCKKSGLIVKTGEFGADTKVELINDGPVTIVVDSKQRE